MTPSAFDRDLFHDRVAVVTGAGEGIGLEIARALSLHGAGVVLNDLDEERAARAAESIREEGGRRCEVMIGDVGEPGVVEELVERAAARYGRLDIAVANAGITLWGPYLEFSRQQFQRVVDVNLAGSFFLAQAAARRMRDQGNGGRLLFVSSVAGRRSIERLSAYGMTKGGLEALTRSLVAELSPYRITVNCVVPGSTLTPRNLAEHSSYAEDWAAVTPLGRTATAVEMAHAALLLLAPQSGHITGQAIVVDGGWTALGPVPGPEGKSP